MDGMVGEHVCAPDLTQAVAGYKTLLVRKGASGKLRLTSPFYKTCTWTAPMKDADCLLSEAFAWLMPGQVPDHDSSPHIDCKCGLYAYHDVEELDKRPIGLSTTGGVFCLTSSTGRLMVHRRGIRSQHQKLEAISLVKRSSLPVMDPAAVRYVKKLCRDWQLPLVDDWRDLPNIAAELGLHPVPPSLFPDA